MFSRRISHFIDRLFSSQNQNENENEKEKAKIQSFGAPRIRLLDFLLKFFNLKSNLNRLFSFLLRIQIPLISIRKKKRNKSD